MCLVRIGLVLLASLVWIRGQEKKTSGPKYCLGRAIGSSLPGRHVVNQAQMSLHDILDQEKLIANDPDVHRFWLLNRIQSKAEEEIIVNVLATYPKIRVLRLSFESDEFRSIPLHRNEVVSRAIPGMPRAFADQLRYVTANNEARNAAIDYCTGIHAQWILPLDGNILIPDETWRGIRALTSVVNDTIILPMKRQAKGQAVTSTAAPSRYEEEPQVMFHSTTVAHFNERYMYGYRPKIDMLRRLCVPGYWDNLDHHEPKYDMDFNKMNSPCSLREVVPPSLPMVVFRINDKVAHSMKRRVQMRNKGMYTAVAHTIANTMLRPHYAFWESPNEDEFGRKETLSSESALVQKPRACVPTGARSGFVDTFSNIIESATLLQGGLLGKALRDERDVVRTCILDVLLLSRISIHMLRQQKCIQLVPFVSDAVQYVSRRMDIFNQGERVEIQAWFSRLVLMLNHLAGESEQSPAKFQKTYSLDWWHRSLTAHAVSHMSTSDSMWRWIALLSTSPWVLHDFSPARTDNIFDMRGNNNGTVPENLRLCFSNAIIELAHIVDISITVSRFGERRYVAMGEGEEACEANTLHHLSGLLLATRLVERHGFNIVHKNLCPAVSYFVADRTPAAWQADCRTNMFMNMKHYFKTSRSVIDMDLLRQRVYSQNTIVCETRPKSDTWITG